MKTPPNRELAVFSAALELPASDRAAYLQQACADDPALRQQVEALLGVHEKALTFLEAPARALDAAALEAEVAGAAAPLSGSPAEKVGDRIGRYKLLEKIGEGGCGIVYMAEQEEPVRRRVALKVIKLGMDTKEVIARFEAERQALALMEHPHIAKIFDGGATDAGRPYFVMELVRGLRITDYCDQHHLSPRQRLDLFMQVCQAVQHAHQKGIIHRDLKPSNILVTVNDGVPVPKVIDFGIAKAAGQRLTDKTLFTKFQQLIGTPAYMSPEQAEMTSVDVDTRSDIYSLGVLLYELLTGRTPFDARELLRAGIEEMLRIIREMEPARPSERLSTLSAIERTTLARQRHTDAPKLLHLLRGDLDWIVMKCLEKDRARRYETAAGLAMDVKRHLDQEPVVARPPTTAYRIQKFARRNRLMVLAGGLVTSALVIGLGVASLMYLREVKARQRALAAERENKHLAEVEKGQRLKAEEQTDIATSMRLAAQSQSLRSQMPALSGLLAIEAVEATRSRGKPVLPVAHESLFYALASIGGRALSGHKLPVRLALISPDGRWLVTAGGDNTARLWDLTAREPWSTAYPLRGHEANVTIAAFSPNGRLLVTGSRDGTARLWHLNRPSITNSSLLNSDQTPITQLAFSPSGHWLATQSGDEAERLIVWDLNADDSSLGKTTLVGGSGSSSATATLILTADGPWLVAPKHASPYNGGLRLWDLTTTDRKARSLTKKTVYPVAISPNRHWLTAIVQNQRAADQLLLWDLRKEMLPDTGTVLDLNEVSGWGTPIDFSDDDRFLAMGNGNIVRVLDLNAEEPGSTVRHLTGNASAAHIYSIKMSHDGRWLASGDRDGTVRLWDLFAGGLEPLARVLSGHAGAVNSIVVSPNGRWLATGSEDKTARLWQLSSEAPEVVGHVLRGHDGSITQMAISPDNRWLVTAGQGDSVPRIWDLGADSPGSKEVVLRTSGIGQGFHPILFVSPDGHWLAASGKPARAWDLNPEDPERNGIDLNLPAEESSLVQPSDPDKVNVPQVISRRWLVTNRWKESPRLWDLKSKDPTTSQQTLLNSTGPICISPDDKWLAVASSENIQLRDLTAGTPATPVHLLRGGRRTASVGISPDSRWLVAGDEDKVVRVWDLSVEVPEASLRTLVGHSTSVSQVLFSGRGGWLFTAGNNGTVRVWDLRSEDYSVPMRVVRLGKFVPRANSSQSREIRISPDGRWIVTATSWGGGNFELWHLPAEGSSNAHRVVEASGSYVAAFSPNSRWLITAADGIPTLWNLHAEATEATKRTLHGQYVVDSAAFSPDSRWLATAGLDGTTRLWDLNSSTQTLAPVVLRGHTSSVRVVEFTADGRWLITGSGDTTARLWDIDTDRLLEKVRSQAGRDFTREERGTYHLETRRRGDTRP